MHNSGTLILVGKRFKLFLIVKDKVFNVHSEKSDCIRISTHCFHRVEWFKLNELWYIWSKVFRSIVMRYNKKPKLKVTNRIIDKSQKIYLWDVPRTF